MSLHTPRLTATLAYESPLTPLHTALLTVSQCPAISQGDFSVAIAHLTRAAAEALAVGRVGVWLYHQQQTVLIEADSYVLGQRCHASGHQLKTVDYPDHFAPSSAENRQCRVMESIAEQTGNFAKRWLRPRQVGALIEVSFYRQGQLAGIMWYEHLNHSRQWQSEEQTFAISIANLVTLALDTQHHQKQRVITQQHQQQALLLRDMLRSVSHSPSNNTALESIIHQIGNSYQALRCHVWQYVPEMIVPLQPAAIYPAAPSNLASEQPAILSVAPQADRFLKQVLATPQGLTSRDSIFATPPDCLGEHWVIVPTLYQGSPNGFVSLQMPGADFLPTGESWNNLKDFAIHLGIALAHSQLLEQEKQQQGTLSRQNKQLQREMIERQQAEQAWQESQRFIHSILDASTNILYVNNFATGENCYVNRCLESVLGYDSNDLRDLGTHYLEKLCHADHIQQMRSHRIKIQCLNDGEIVESEYQFRHRQGGWRWLLCRETIFQRDAEGRPTQVFGTATDITERKQAEVALYEANQELKRLANIDGLTEVANRRSFDDYLCKAWENLRHGSTALSLILCDIDYFKRYNDEYGHQSGDLCLKQVAQAISRAAKRSTDLVARYGGEEFAIVLSNTSAEGAQRVAAEVQQQIGQLKIPHCRSLIDARITVSLGIATVTDSTRSTPDRLIAAADQGLYQAKYEGRNRTCMGVF